MYVVKKRIRKDENGKIRVTDTGYLQSLLFIFMPLLFGFVFIVGIIKSGESIIPLFIVSIILLVFVYFGVRMYIREHNIMKAKNLKKDGGGIVKKVKITSIQHYYKSGDDNTRGFDGDYLEAKDGNKIYCSDAFEGGFYAGLPLKVFQDIYREYGYEFDEKQVHKNDVLKQINIRISEKELKNSEGFVEKLGVKWGLLALNRQKRIVEKGYKASFFQINGHEISIGDTVDVYIDPEDEENYWMDIDFLFEK